jgi:hypothetical protein
LFLPATATLSKFDDGLRAEVRLVLPTFFFRFWLLTHGSQKERVPLGSASGGLDSDVVLNSSKDVYKSLLRFSPTVLKDNLGLERNDEIVENVRLDARPSVFNLLDPSPCAAGG